MGMILNSFGNFADTSFHPVLGPLISTSDVNVPSSSTYVSKYAAGVFQNVGSNIRLSLQGPLTAGRSSVLSAIYIGHATAIGNAYDFDGGQVAITFAASGSVTLAAGQVKVSEVITFSINPTKALLIAYNATTTNLASRKTGLGLNYTYYVGAAVSQAATSAKNAGYTPVGGSSIYLRLLDASS